MAAACGAAIALVFAMLLPLAAGAAQQVDAAFEARLKNLETGLRCLVCQNQTLADSNASLADDLRREVRELALSGKSDDEIKSYLVARYGDFVLYKPPLQANTLLLWLAPFALLACGALLWWTLLRQRQARRAGVSESAAAGSPAHDELESVERARARGRALLQDDGPAEARSGIIEAAAPEAIPRVVQRHDADVQTAGVPITEAAVAASEVASATSPSQGRSARPQNKHKKHPR